MDHIIIIFDQLKNTYTLVSGGNQVQIETERKLNNPRNGYQKVLDQEMPMVSNTKLEIGLDAELYFSIRCNQTGEWKISYEEYEWLDKLFQAGPFFLKSYIEGIVSRIKGNLVSRNKDPLFIFGLLNSVFPDVMELIQEQMYFVKDKFPYLGFEARAMPNLSNIYDEYLKNNQKILGEAWLNIASARLSSAYDPEVELAALTDHYKNLSKMLPIPDPPSQQEINSAKAIINLERQNQYTQNALGSFGGFPSLPNGI